MQAASYLTDHALADEIHRMASANPKLTENMITQRTGAGKARLRRMVKEGLIPEPYRLSKQEMRQKTRTFNIGGSIHQ